MDVDKLLSLINALDDNLDDLEEAVSPILKGTISDTACTLPLLDRAHLYVLCAYSLESLIFCSYLLLHLGGLANEQLICESKESMPKTTQSSES